MRKSQLLYIRLAILFIACAIMCYTLKMCRFPGDTTIIRLPDTTLHDLIYFNAENFVNLCGLIAFTNLCYLASTCFPESLVLLRLKRVSVVLVAILLCRTVGNAITYYKISDYEQLADTILVSLLFITCRPDDRADHSILT